MAAIDHLMWAVPDLAAGVDRLESLTGVRAASGGAHPGMGTANVLLGLGPGVYLEVIGPDPALDEPTGFGALLAALDAPELRSWAIRTDDIDQACAALDRGWVADRAEGDDEGDPRRDHARLARCDRRRSTDR